MIAGSRPVDVETPSGRFAGPSCVRGCRCRSRPTPRTDDSPGTLHLGALTDDGTVVGCATWFPEPWEGRPAWRLRGMATDPSVRGTGVGSALLQRGLAEARAAGVEVAWCNARTVALAFYRRHGFESVGAEFVTAHGVPHYVMWRTLGA